MWAIIALSIAAVVCMMNGGVEVETSTRVKVGGKRKKADKKGEKDDSGDASEI